MNRINYGRVFKEILPIAIILFIILVSELQTEGAFGGLVTVFKYTFFFIAGLGVIFFTLKKQLRNIRKNQHINEAKLILITLFISSIIAITSFYFPHDYYHRKPELFTKNNKGTKLTLGMEKFVLKTIDYEGYTIDRGFYEIKSDTIILDKVKNEKSSSQRTNKYLIQNNKVIPIYSDGIEKDSLWFLLVD